MSKVILMAALATEAMATIGNAFGDKDVVFVFEDLPEAQRQGLTEGIEMLLANPEAGADARHNAWLEKMQADGWTYAKQRNDETKKHPRIVPFDELPKKEIVKEQILLAIVRHLAGAKLPAHTSVSAPGTVQIEYVGNKDEHTDNLYGTHLVWRPGDVHPVPSAAAAKMLHHTDTYKQAGQAAAAETAAPEAPATEPESDPEKMPIPLPNLPTMTRDELASFAQQHYGEKFPDDMTEDGMRDTILAFVQGRGR